MRLRWDPWVKESWGALVPWTRPKTSRGLHPSQVKLPPKRQPPDTVSGVPVTLAFRTPARRPGSSRSPADQSQENRGWQTPRRYRREGHCFPFLAEGSLQGQASSGLCSVSRDLTPRSLARSSLTESVRLHYTPFLSFS